MSDDHPSLGVVRLFLGGFRGWKARLPRNLLQARRTWCWILWSSIHKIFQHQVLYTHESHETIIGNHRDIHINYIQMNIRIHCKGWPWHIVYLWGWHYKSIRTMMTWNKPYLSWKRSGLTNSIQYSDKPFESFRHLWTLGVYMLLLLGLVYHKWYSSG